MTALVRYQAALLLRSQRWIVPVLVYAAVVVSGSNGGEPLGDGLAWSAAMALPAAAWLMRCCLTNEPAAARAALAAAGGARQAQLSALIVAGIGSVLLVGGGSVFEVLVSKAPTGTPGFGPVAGAGVLAGLTAALTGLAVGALLNPPIVRRPGPAVLATVTVVVWALASSFSPALAAIRRAAPVRGSHLPLVPALAAVGITALCWSVSVLAAAQRADAGP
jgi:hypothetical protein